MYRVLLERGAEKDLSRLSSDIHDRVIAAIQALATSPRPPGCRKLAGGKHDWRIRVGDYRVVYEIADQTSPRSLSLTTDVALVSSFMQSPANK